MPSIGTPQVPITPQKRALQKLHPMFRTFCPSADATTEEPEHPTVCPVVLLLLPLVLLILGCATGLLFDPEHFGATMTSWYHSGLADVTSLPVLAGVGVFVLLVAVWAVARRVHRHRAAHS